jgi:hypothetical protein
MTEPSAYPRSGLEILSDGGWLFESQAASMFDRRNSAPLVVFRGPLQRKFATCLALGIVLAASARLAAAETRTAQEKLAQTNWSDIHGVNFVPTYAKNTYEIWRNYDHDAFARELGLAAGVGFNTVRLWLNYAAYEELGPQMVDHVEDAVRLCAKYHLRVMVNLFDSCGVRPRQDAKLMPASEAYDEFQRSPRFSPAQKFLMQRLFENYVRGMGAQAMVPVGADSPMMVLVWGNWQPTPGNDRLGPEWYPQLGKYVDAMVGRLKDNPNVLLWDLMNEPEFASEGPLSPTEFITPEMKKICDAFLQHFHDYMKQRYPNELVCEGWANVENADKYADLADVLTFHVYGGPEQIQSAVDKAQVFGERRGKKVVITETLAKWDFGTADFGKKPSAEMQLAHYQRVLPVLMNSHIGWVSFGLVGSKEEGPDPFIAILTSDGRPRPAALYLEKILKESGTSK